MLEQRAVYSTMSPLRMDINKRLTNIPFTAHNVYPGGFVTILQIPKQMCLLIYLHATRERGHKTVRQFATDNNLLSIIYTVLQVVPFGVFPRRLNNSSSSSSPVEEADGVRTQLRPPPASRTITHRPLRAALSRWAQCALPLPARRTVSDHRLTD